MARRRVAIRPTVYSCALQHPTLLRVPAELGWVWTDRIRRPGGAAEPARRADRQPKEASSLLLAELLTEVVLEADLLDQAQLGLQEIHVTFFVLENPLEQVGRAVVARLPGRG